MYSKSLGAFVWYSIGFVTLTTVIFTALHSLQVPSGQFIDWVIGAVTAWWLLIIVTVPWNVHFEAKSVIYEAERSAATGIKVDQAQLKYVQKVARRALILAIALHLFSAAGLFLLSALHITPVGYVGCVAALLLTAVRPAVRAYEYLCARLTFIKEQAKYPREDVVELRGRVKSLEDSLILLQSEFDPNCTSGYVFKQRHITDEMREKLNLVLTEQQRTEFKNREDHERIMQEGQNAIARISADTQFLDHVREIVRLIKTA